MSHTLPIQASETAQRIELEHGWEFLPDRTGKLRYADLANVDGWRPARAGVSWNVLFEDLRDYMGAAWYRTYIEVPVFGDRHHVLLKFGAVDYFCELFINGVPVGSHEGGYTPFSFDITHVLHSGTNEIALLVIDPPMNEAENRELFPEMMYNEIPHGKQNWYVQNSGIWQGVRLEFCPALYIDRVDMTTEYNGNFTGVVRFAGAGLNADGGAIAEATTLTFSISDASGRVIVEESEPVGSRNFCEIRGTIPNRKTWSPDAPNLYFVDVALSGAVRYRRKARFGFRKIEARDSKLYLNEKPFYMVATLDQDFYPETIHTPASEEFVREMMMKAKKLGVNVLRCHLKVAHPVYLDIADEIGMLVWAEMPSWSDSWFPSDHFSHRAAMRGEHMFNEIIIRDWNHPCIIVRTIMNESWGINLKQEEQRRWLKDAFDRIKEMLRPLNRLVIDNSACEGNFHIKTDIEDFHQYYSMPDQVKNWDKWLDELASRPAWTFSPYGDAERTGKEPLLVSEFGNWGLPLLPREEELPWWFHYSFGGRDVTNPAGVFDRFNEFLKNTVFRDYNDFAEESQWHQYISLKYEIESIRAKASIQGYVITAMTDVHWEVNGLLDMWRNPKAFAEEFPKLQRPDLVIARPEKWTAFGGDELRAELLFSHYSDIELAGVKVRWTTESGASGTVTLPAIEPGTVASIATLQWKAPDVSQATAERLWLDVRGRHGARIAENHLDVFILPKPTEVKSSARVVGDGLPQLAERLRGRGYQAADSGVVISDRVDEALRSYVSGGGDAIVLVNSDDALPKDWTVQPQIRAGSEYDGRWFSNFNWIRNDRAPFESVGFSRILGFESVNVVPDYVLINLTGAEFRDVLCGVTYGWLQRNSAIALQARLGKGKIIATTFRFDLYGEDAYATTLLDSLIRYIQSGACTPTLELN